ncbi:MAG: SUF system Fe-S cluster assembly protein [Deltaproteobacteria bacterium]|nr:SUF system Fe-S cluster assembly protein [Deltaproteobacteria bacterium]
MSEELKNKIIEALKTCFDPEIPVDIYELGLIYEININPDSEVDLKMTLTSPACPVAGSLPPEVEEKVRGVEGVKSAKVDLVWDPPWTPEKMSEMAKLQLNMF